MTTTDHPRAAMVIPRVKALRAPSFAIALSVLAAIAPPTLAQAGVVRGAQGAAAQGDTAVGAAAGLADSAVARIEPASPRASIAGFLEAAREGDFVRAAHWLDPLAPHVGTRGAELAQRLTAILDTHVEIDLDALSPLAIGDTADGLHPDRERLGDVPGADGRQHPIFLARRVATGEPRWTFAGSAIVMVDQLYGELPDGWIRAHLPRTMLAEGPFGILWWQWAGLLTVILVGALVGWLLTAPSQWLLRKTVSRTKTDLDDALVASARGPIMLLWALAAFRVLLHWIALGPAAHGFIVDFQRAIAVVAVFWVLVRALDVVQDALPRSEWATRNPSLRTLIPFGGRVARVLVMVAGLLTVVATFGYPIATILAGLGIGGIAVALGAQKSLEHFFGSVSIGVDQPFRVGDWVTVSGVSGSIEEIGLRSTRIRTLGRTIISIPNGVLAESQSENFGHRDRFALLTTIGVEYGTSVAMLRLIRDRIREMLLEHPKLWEQKASVHFVNFGASSLDIEILCWLSVQNIDEFKVVREEIYLRVMEIVEGNGASFAFPTQTIHVKGDGRRVT